MESLVLAGALILLITTLFYAWFTYRLLKETRQEAALYKGMLERQLKLASFPHLHCDIVPDLQAGVLRLEVFNVGNVPAYDIQICTIGAYTEEGTDIPTFMRSYVQPRYRKYPLQVDKVGYYGIRSSVRSPLLPAQKKLSTVLSLPIRPVDVYALVQCREVLGSNYYQVFCFSDLDATGGYRANVLEPTRLEPMERLHLYDIDDAKPTSSDRPLPYYLNDFTDLWNHSLSARYTTAYTGEEANQQQELKDVV